MKSIRQSLMKRLLISFGIIWTMTGVSIFLSYRSGLINGLEAELTAQLRQVRMLHMSTVIRGGSQAIPQLSNANFLWQVWPLAGGFETIRSHQLMSDLPRLDAPRGETRTRFESLEDGTRVLLVSGTFGMGQSSGFRNGPGAIPVEITLARDLASMHKKLTGVAASISIIGILSGLCLGAWIAHTVGVGLGPLQAIAARASSMEVDRLGEGFQQSGLPVELSPIVERLNQLLARVAQSFDREKQFSADLAHEIRTPLAELRMNAGSALKWPEDSGPDDWKAVLNSVDRMENITNAMLLLARIERHPADPGDQTVSLKPIVEECLNSRSSNAHQRELRLINSLPEEARLPGIPELWQSMIDNIIGNAVEYADAGTEITVSWSFSPPSLHIDNAASNLDPEDAGHLFDRFWRKDRARTAAKHSGLGLAIAKACADAMGLAISARITSPPPDRTTHLTFSIQPITHFKAEPK